MFANKEKAEKTAQRFLAAHSVDDTRVPVRALARASGCILKLTPMDDDLSGMAFIKDGLRAIIVNSRHHPNRQRFTVAHELAHHQLHLLLLQQGVHVDKAIFGRGVFNRDEQSATGTEPYEIEANAFAAELLMPRRTIKKLVPPSFDLQDESGLAEIASQFGVSAIALQYRITNVFND